MDYVKGSLLLRGVSVSGSIQSVAQGLNPPSSDSVQGVIRNYSCAEFLKGGSFSML